MFHLQKSNRSSSDDNIEINLLQKPEQDRASRINFIRDISLRNNKKEHGEGSGFGLFKALKNRKSSYDLNPKKVEKHEREASAATQKAQMEDNYSNLAVQPPIRASVSILTDASNHSKFIGLILFTILLLFTPLEIVTLVYASSGFSSTSRHSNQSILLILLAAEFLSFGILYYLEWIERVNIFKELYQNFHLRKNDDNRRFQHPLNNPYLLTLVVVAATIVFELAYVQAVVQESSSSSLVLFITILPQVSMTLLFEDELYFGSSCSILKLFYASNLWFMLVALLSQSYFTLIASVTMMLLIYLMLRVGRECIYIEYMVGRALLFLTVLTKQLTQGFSSEQNGELPSIWLCVVLLTLSMLAVRCINNLILRTELYKYFYSDADINCSLLCIPVLLSWLQGDLKYLLAIGCVFLIGVCYKVGRDKLYVNMGF